MKKFTTGLLALLLSATALNGCDILGLNKDKKDENETHEDVQKTVSVTGVSLGAEEISLYVGNTTTLTAEVAPANATNKKISWSSDNEDVASVEGGVVTGKAVGIANITVTTEDGSKTATCKITVSEKPAGVVSVTGITLDKTVLTLTVDDTATLVATVAPENATNKSFSWSTSDKSVATITDGVVKAVGAGTATIKATTSDGGKFASCVVTVNPKQTVFEKSVNSGAVIELEGTGYTFAEGSTQNEIIHVEEVGGNTKVFGIKGGVATLAKGVNTYPITVNLNVVLLEVGSAHSFYAVRAGNMQMAEGIESLKFTVGSKNKFVPHFNLVADSYPMKDGAWDELDTDDLKIDLLDAGTHFAKKPTLSVDSTYATVNDDLSVSFKPAAVGQDVTLTMSLDAKSVNTVVHVAEGYNAHNHEEFKALFEDTSVGGTINVVRNIQSTLSEDRFFEDPAFTAPDGSHMFPNNLYESGHTKDSAGKITTGSVYDRHFNKDEEANDIEINGNFLEMNAQSVPDHVPSFVPGQREPYGPENAKVPNNAEGLFYITSHKSSGHDVTIRNLFAKGNSDRANGTLDTEIAIGAYGLAGISFDSAAVSVVNSQFDHFERGVNMVYANAKMKVTNSVIQDTWGPSFTGYCADSIDVVHSKFTNAGGPIFFLLANGNKVYDQAETKVSWDVTSQISNFVSTNTSWCQANGLSGVGQGLQGIDDAVNPAGLTIKNGDKFNFIYVSMTNQHDAPTGVTYIPVKDVVIKDGETVLVEAKESPSAMPTDPNSSFIPNLASAFGGSFLAPLGQTYAQMDAAIGTKLCELLPVGDLQTAMTTLAGMSAQDQAQVLAGAFGGALTSPLQGLAVATGHMYFDVTYHAGEINGDNYGSLAAIIEVMPKA